MKLKIDFSLFTGNRSMTDLDQHSTQSPRRKFSFRFPNLSHSGSHDKDNGAMSALSNGNGYNGQACYNGKERRTFSEAAKNVPDLQVRELS